ncbi:MAG: hypothetical protein M1833_004247 [Piccolia ochrophora]|nr:MAG: hypothetical protein M1833_004247 [Piccolia ochrophora]
MAAKTEILTAPAAEDVAILLAEDDIPYKLRCAICNKLAVNAFRLPCCDQSICETCQTSIPSACPVCEHAPLSGEDCKPNKSLRTTIKVFLRTEAKKREVKLGKDRKEVSATPAAPAALALPVKSPSIPVVAETQSTSEERHSKSEGAAKVVDDEGVQGDRAVNSEQLVAEGDSLPIVESIEPNDGDKAYTARHPEGAAPANPAALLHGVNGGNGAQLDRPGSNVVNGENGRSHVQQEGQQNQELGQTHENNTQGMGGNDLGFQNMNWNAQAVFNPMTQEGVTNGGWGMFSNMTGMPGMNMDPMTMAQGMYGGFNGQSMDMTGMNGMNMGLGMGFDSGQGGYGGWNGQSLWNGGQDNFNPNANGGMGDFGAHAGYHPSAGGHSLQSHGNYSQMQQQQYQNHNYQDNFQGQGYYSRGRGRGRGFGQNRHQAGYGQGFQGNNQAFNQQLPHHMQQNQQDFSRPHSQQRPINVGGNGATSSESEVKVLTEGPQSPLQITSANHDTMQNGVTEDTERDLTDGNAADETKTASIDESRNLTDASVNEAKEEAMDSMQDSGGTNDGAHHSTSGGQGNEVETITTTTTNGPSAPVIPPTNQRLQVGAVAYGAIYVEPLGFEVVVEVGQSPTVLTAPPLLMRLPTMVMEGPLLSLKGKGSLVHQRLQRLYEKDFQTLQPALEGFQSLVVVAKAITLPLPLQLPLRERRAALQTAKSHEVARVLGPPHRATIAPTRAVVNDLAHGADLTIQAIANADKSAAVAIRAAMNRKDKRSRSPSASTTRSRSPSSAKRSSHRSRHGDKERTHKSHRSHRSHRDRSRDRERRHRHRHRSRSRSPLPIDGDGRNGIASERNEGHRSKDQTIGSHRHSHRNRSRSGSPTISALSPQQSRRPSGREEHLSKPSIDDSYPSSNRATATKRPSASQPPTPTTTTDVHTLEREARNRERMLKEQQRRDELNREREVRDRERKHERERDAGGGEEAGAGKRRRTGGSGREKGGRRVSHQYEYKDDEGEEERAIRVEREREAARWG